MKKIILIIGLILFCTSCFLQIGRWEEGKCRPKNPSFKLLKKPFKETEKLTFNKVYVADNFTKATGYGFYSKGRLICFDTKDGFALKKDDVVGKNWNNAIAIGYWRVEKDKIEIQYFVCGDSGVYIIKQGEIKGDTIIFERNCGSNPFKTVKCPEKYVLSDMSFE